MIILMTEYFTNVFYNDDYFSCSRTGKRSVSRFSVSLL